MRNRVLFFAIFVIILSLSLAWISTAFSSLQGWVSFLILTLFGAGILAAGWWAIKIDFEPRNTDKFTSRAPESNLPAWLSWLLVGAALLRLGAGVLWFVVLPQAGYGGEAELAGYVMGDAFERDMAAWDLAESPWPLSTAFREFRGEDQYGGMLFGSAFIYRHLGGETHQPLQIIVMTASFSALAVLFTWAFTRRLWSAQVASLAAWIVALFPDAVLLGSSQMREAFLMTLTMMSFYGLVRTFKKRTWVGILWIVFPLVICLPLSPLVAVMLAGMLMIWAFFLGDKRWLKNWYVWAVLIGLLVLGLVVVGLFGERILPGGTSNPLALLQRWLKQTARWQAYTSEHASGWMQKIFRSTPEWTHTWLLLIYGVARPFLPAALFDHTSAEIWQGIAIWRALGWTVLLPLLVVAPWMAWKRTGFRSPAMGLSLLVWAGIFISSFRGGGDQFDNPRYRITWIGLQAALAAWVWGTQRQERSPWLRRTLVGMGLILLWWMPWYLRRMTDFVWPIQDVFLTLGLGLLSATVYWIVDVWWVRRKSADS